MEKIRVVTDSGADIPENLVQELGIRVVPLTIHFGAEERQDGVDLSPEEFYRRLAAGEMSHTSQPSPAQFETAYRELVEEGAEVIISCHLSSTLSGTMQSAQLAARAVDVPVRVVDTRSASRRVGLVAIEAARPARAGEPVSAIVQRLESIIARQRVLFMVDTLEYLQRNGRIGKAQAFVGGLLNIKPILTLEDGVVAPLERARGRARAVARLFERMAQTAAGKLRVAVMHSQADQEAAGLAERIRSRFDVAEVITGLLGPTIGTHVGPGTLGVVYHSV
ncbi:MAG: DegV family protein [Firmicutes bacterium]|nr:DegV family protein [Bacillota bacterium]